MSKQDPTDAIVDQIGLFFRRSQALYQALKPDEVDEALERPAYILLGMIVRNGPVRPTALAEESQLNLSTISRQVSALEQVGLITRQEDPADRRASLVRVSDRGLVVYERNVDRWRHTMSDLVTDWDTAEQREFARLFARLNDAMAARVTAGRGK